MEHTEPVKYKRGTFYRFVFQTRQPDQNTQKYRQQKQTKDRIIIPFDLYIFIYAFVLYMSVEWPFYEYRVSRTFV